MSLDLLCINPGGTAGIYQHLGADLTAVEPPLWCRLIAGYVRDRGYTVRILDAAALGLGPEEVARRVVEARPKLVCVVVHGHQPSASTQTMPAAGAICRAIKAANRFLQILIVGGHVAALPERTLAEEAVDFACTGEGPVTVVGVLEGLLSNGRVGDDVPGLAWREGKTASAPLIADLDADLHGNTWDLLPMGKYRAHNWHANFSGARQPYASIMTSLDCPFSCHFCCISAPFGRKHLYRMRAPASVVAEVNYLAKMHGVRLFKIVDEMFVLNPKHYVAICEGLAVLPFASELNIWAYARVDTVKAGHLPLLRRAGFRWLALGIESGSAHVRDGADKHYSDDDIRAVVREIQAAGINVIGNYIFGLPDDDMDSMQRTLALAKELNTEFANFYSAMAYPGSPLYDQAVANHSELPKGWSGYSQHSTDTFPMATATLSSADVLRFRDAAFTDYFTDARYLDMIGEKFGAGARAQIEQMTARQLDRALLRAA